MCGLPVVMSEPRIERFVNPAYSQPSGYVDRVVDVAMKCRIAALGYWLESVQLKD